MDVRIPTQFDKRLGSENTKMQQVVVDSSRQKQLCGALPKLAVYLKQGMKLKRVNKVFEFEQECWMEPYIRMNTEFRKNVKSDFEKNFYKLMN